MADYRYKDNHLYEIVGTKGQIWMVIYDCFEDYELGCIEYFDAETQLWHENYVSPKRFSTYAFDPTREKIIDHGLWRESF